MLLRLVVKIIGNELECLELDVLLGIWNASILGQTYSSKIIIIFVVFQRPALLNKTYPPKFFLTLELFPGLVRVVRVVLDGLGCQASKAMPISFEGCSLCNLGNLNQLELSATKLSYGIASAFGLRGLETIAPDKVVWLGWVRLEQPLSILIIYTNNWLFLINFEVG